LTGTTTMRRAARRTIVLAFLSSAVACSPSGEGGQRLADREAIEQVLARANLGLELVVMKTNVDIHMSAVGRYEDELVKRDGVWLIAKRRRIE